ncbi:MAG TPA: hypothetical protein VIF09_22685 [Polyangiaceae bacterium]
MPPLRARLALVVVAAAGALGAWASACGLPQSGLGAAVEAGASGGGDGTTSTEGSAAGDDGGPSSGCSSIDAACLGPLPSGWQPIGVTDAGCAAGFTVASLVTNPRVEDGGCACGACQVIGAFSCTAATSISGGDNNCGDPTLIDASPGVCTQAQAQHVEAHPVNATGTVACFAPNDAGAGATVDPLRVCVPGCTADYCAGSSRCIAADDQVPCPSGFHLLAYAGTGADPGCAPCACEAGAPGACSGNVTVFLDSQCSADASPSVYAVGTCNLYNAPDYNSLRVDLVPPAPTCSAGSGGPGDASLVQVRTICCQ